MESIGSFVAGAWQMPKKEGQPLVNPTTEATLAHAGTGDLDWGRAVEFARGQGGASLRNLTYAQRGDLLKKLAEGITAIREELIGLAVANGGNTRSDAKFDIDGAAATLQHYAELGAKLGDRKVLLDGEPIALGRSARLFGQHIWVPREGVAIQISAFNFPAWGMAEKLATAILAGMPVIAKPATATALVAHRIAQQWTRGSLLPEGAFSFIGGGVGKLLSALTGQDVVAFTGSGQTAEGLRSSPELVRSHAHLNVEADSLNAAVLGPDVGDGSETWSMFINDLIKEMTQKAGQKCTAFRRIFVPDSRIDRIREQVVERLSEVKVGDPSNESTAMGPLATLAQKREVLAGIERLSEGSEVAFGGSASLPSKGFFVSPTLLMRRGVGPSDLVHRLEVFGPVATLVPYPSPTEVSAQVAAGGGGLIAAVYSDDREFLKGWLMRAAPFHGRIAIGSEKIAGKAISPGTALPTLLHGGPGRAGGGEELGGERGMRLYQQRVAVQGDRGLLEELFN